MAEPARSRPAPSPDPMPGAGPAVRPAAAPAGAGGAADPLAPLRLRLREDLAPLVQRIDHEGFYPAEAMRSLGESGAFGLHLAGSAPGGRADLALAVAAVAEISATCMSTGFCTWCQDASGWYLEHSDNAALRARLQPSLASGARGGGTGLSNPVKALAGIERFKLRGRRVAGGWSVSGVLPWVSNLAPAHVFGTIFADEDDPAHRVMAMVHCDGPGVRLRGGVRFVALEGTGTYGVALRDAFIPEEDVLADPLGDLAVRVRPGFVLLQAGMGLGVARACLAVMRAEDRTHAGTNRFLPEGADAVEARIEAAAEEGRAACALAEAARADGARGLGSAPVLRAVLSARLRVSELALDAARAAQLHSGARGYLENSPVHRLLREAWFVAIITPSVRHLRMELDRLGPA